MGQTREQKHVRADGECGAERTCIVTRGGAPQEELIRFVRGPDGTAVPDISSKLPGRGAWVGCSATLVEKAIRTQAFSRAFRTKTHADDLLVAQVDMLLVRRVLDTLSLANKAGCVVSGYNKVDAAIEAGKIGILVQAVDASLAPRQRLRRKFIGIAEARKQDAKSFELLTIDELSLALGRENVVHAAVIGSRSTALFAQVASRLARYRAMTSFAVAETRALEDEGDASEPVCDRIGRETGIV